MNSVEATQTLQELKKDWDIGKIPTVSWYKDEPGGKRFQTHATTYYCYTTQSHKPCLTLQHTDFVGWLKIPNQSVFWSNKKITIWTYSQDLDMHFMLAGDNLTRLLTNPRTVVTTVNNEKAIFGHWQPTPFDIQFLDAAERFL